MQHNDSAVKEDRLAVLDGWRGISIILVLCTHLLPLGPKAWALNDTFGPMGMALFFTLSGFLITRFLLHDANISDFLIRRFSRIVPLAYVAIIVALLMEPSPSQTWFANLLFYANLPPQHLTEVASHLWSLCLEMQFYVAIALLVAFLGKRGLFLIPVFCVAVTLNRMRVGAYVDIVTWLRVDEILAGSILAQVFAGRFGATIAKVLLHSNTLMLFGLLLICSHPAAGFINYFRPYAAAMLVGSTLYAPSPRWLKLLTSRELKYIAAISYALYVIHHILMFTWLGAGEKVIKYMKRPLLIIATFALAHVSTFHFERHFIALGKALGQRINRVKE